MESKRKCTCTCAYCNHFRLAEYFESCNIVKQGICRKHEKFCEIFDEICDDFVILQGLRTNKWYPNKEDTEKSEK